LTGHPIERTLTVVEPTFIQRVGAGVPPAERCQAYRPHLWRPSMAVAQQGLEKARMNRVAFASLAGTTIEWYDFYIYGTAGTTWSRCEQSGVLPPVAGLDDAAQ